MYEDDEENDGGKKSPLMMTKMKTKTMEVSRVMMTKMTMMNDDNDDDGTLWGY